MEKLNSQRARSVDEAAVPTPSYDMQHPWEAYFKELPIEYAQSVDEGKDIEKYKDLIFAIAALPNDKIKSELSDIVYKIVENCPIKEDYPYHEPSDIEQILECSEKIADKLPALDETTFADKMKGAWYGRICGCLLGKPIEGMKRRELLPFLKNSGNYPMHRYIVPEDAKVFEGTFNIANRVYPDGILDAAPSDDDTNYVVLAYLILKRCGRDFTPKNVADIWLETQPRVAYCTAERVAFRNFLNGYLPPDSARYKNPYREWIGAQIRGDLFGWVNPGDPEGAARMAFKDASISHVKNGIYGEMWVAATLAAAGAGCDILESIRIGLSYIPTESRFHKAISDVISFYLAGGGEEEFFASFNSRWDDEDGHHWCHTISNAEIVAASLLYGGGDYGKSICLAVSQGFDTDCNGATVGSIVGMCNGFDALSKEWTDKVNDTLITSIFGYEIVSIGEMAQKTLDLIG